MIKKYFVNNGGENLGPFPLSTIIEKVKNKEFKAEDKIYNAIEDTWMMISEHPEFDLKGVAEEIRPQTETETVLIEPSQSSKMVSSPDLTVLKSQPCLETVPVTNEPVVNADQAQWYVLKAQNRFGPFPYLDLIKMLQNKSVFEFDYVWRQGLATWTRIAEVSDFSKEKIRYLIGEKQVQKEDIFYRRKHCRWPFETSLIVHDNNSLWKGKTVELSEGGVGAIMENSLLLPGQNVYIHFKAGPNMRSFNVLCEVVSKKYDKSIKDKDTAVVYGLKFINILKQDREVIKSIFEKAA